MSLDIVWSSTVPPAEGDTCNSPSRKACVTSSGVGGWVPHVKSEPSLWSLTEYWKRLILTLIWPHQRTEGKGSDVNTHRLEVCMWDSSPREHQQPPTEGSDSLRQGSQARPRPPPLLLMWWPMTAGFRPGQAVGSLWNRGLLTLCAISHRTLWG